ncbi:MarR family winged helix-turn-helix transcriptional regulator [Paraoerskovia marina]|uniref:MarR family winged helix-turn-helix transcriptional regulator n=1 Tax=Paraoerskovia marina TaxID=545619 RepID=UPI0004924B90|nr:MarR family transcriptional regulator [Paraoerskovia marina]
MTTEPTDAVGPHGGRTVDLLRALDEFARTQRDIGNRMAADLGLQRSTLTVLRILEREGSLPLGDLAAALRVDLSVASRHVNALVERGYVDREVCTTDRRVRLLTLTATGHATVRRISEVGAEIVAATFTAWTDTEIDDAVAVVTRVTEALQNA